MNPYSFRAVLLPKLPGMLFMLALVGASAWAIRPSPAGTFRTTDLIVDNTTVVKGNVGLCTDGTTSCTNIPHITWNPTQVSGGATGRMDLLGTYAAWNQLNGATADVMIADTFCQGTANATATNVACRGGEFDALATRSAGAHNVVNTALTLQAANGQANVALDSLAGDVNIANGHLAVVSGPTSLTGGDVTTGAHVTDLSASTSILLNNNVSSFEIPGGPLLEAEISIGTPNVNDGTQLQTKNIRTADGSVGIDVGLDTTINALIEGGLFITRGVGGSFGSGQKGLWVGPGNILTPAEAANDLTIYNVEAGKSILFVAGGIGTAHTSYAIRPTGHITVEGSAPTPDAGCTSGGGSVLVGTDNSFAITTGATSIACTVTFHDSWTLKPICSEPLVDGSTTLPTCTISPTAITCMVNLANTTYHWNCRGQPGST